MASHPSGSNQSKTGAEITEESTTVNLERILQPFSIHQLPSPSGMIMFSFLFFFLKQERIPLNIKHTNAQHQQILILNDEHYDFSTRSVGQMNKRFPPCGVTKWRSLCVQWAEFIPPQLLTRGRLTRSTGWSFEEVELQVIDYAEGEILRLWINSKRWS